MQCLEVSGAVRPIYGSLGVKRLITLEIGFVHSRAIGRYPEWHLVNGLQNLYD